MHRCRLFCFIIREYTSRWIHTSNKALTLSWRRFLSYKNQSIDLLCKLMEWFLYDKDIRHERVNTLFTHHTPEVCSYMSWGRISFFFFFFFAVESSPLRKASRRTQSRHLWFSIIKWLSTKLRPLKFVLSTLHW